MTRFIVYALFCFVCLGVFGQTKAPELYIVSDPDGYVNLRSGPGTEYESYEKVVSKFVVKRDTSKVAEKGWIPVRLYTSVGYIFQDRLIPVKDKSIASKINKCITTSDNEAYNSVAYAMSLDIPELYLISDRDCEFTVCDLKRDEIILGTGVPVCFQIINGDTLSFYRMDGYSDDNWGTLCRNSTLPMMTIYKIYKREDGHFDYYTEIFPEPRKVSLEKAEATVEEIRKKIKDVEYVFRNYDELCERLLTAYYSGADKAMEVLSGFPCDASLCHEQDICLSMMEAYRRSKIKPK